jgi:hypothetical protein
VARLPQTNPDLRDWLNEIEGRIKSLEGRSAFYNTGLRPVGNNTTSLDKNLDVADLGRITFPEGGSLLMKDTSGREYLYAGGLSTNGFGLKLTRINGSPALVFADDDELEEAVQRLRLYDSNARPLLAEDASGEGSAWPLVPIPFAGVSWPTWDYNSTSTFTTVASALLYKTSARAYVICQHIGSDTATGQVRLMANGTQLGTTATVANLAQANTTFGTPLALPGAIGEPVTLEIQTRVASGAGKAHARVIGAHQWSS